jgi:hypothetical protein
MRAVEIFKYSADGNMPPRGNLDEAEAILTFPFGFIGDSNGDYFSPGATNIALAEYIADSRQLREKDIVLTEELADALDGDTDGDIKVISNFLEEAKASSTFDYAVRAAEYFRERNIGSVAVVAFRHHLPRAEASVSKVGLSTVVPELRQVGDFDPQSYQWRARSRARWIAWEVGIVPASVVLNQI